MKIIFIDLIKEYSFLKEDENIFYINKLEDINFDISFEIFDVYVFIIEHFNEINKKIIEIKNKNNFSYIIVMTKEIKEIKNKDFIKYVDYYYYLNDDDNKVEIINLIKQKIKNYQENYYNIYNKVVNLNMLFDKFAFIETNESYEVKHISSNFLNKHYNLQKIKNIKEILKEQEIKELENNQCIIKEIEGQYYNIDYIKIDDNYFYILNKIYTEDNIIEIQKEIKEHKNYITSEIFAKLSHELRTPIMAVSMFFEYLKNFIRDEDLKNKIDLCFNELKNVSKILNYSIDFVKINNYTEIINIKEILEKIIYLYKSLYINININFYCKKEYNNIIIRCNPVHFKNVISNLIKNAIEELLNNNIEDPKIDVILDIYQINGINLLKISIIDNAGGLKIPKNDVFNIFRTSKKNGGTGIGLAYCKQVIENIGGKILINNYEKGVKVDLIFVI